MAEDSSKRELNSTAASLLGFLHEGPMSGWDLVNVADDRIGDFWTVTQSQVYRELSAMNRAGLLDRGEPGARDRTPYHLTDAGREAFAEWIARDPGPETIRVPLLLTLSFGQFVEPARLRRIIAANREIHEQRLAGYLDECGGEKSRYDGATLDFGIRYERAVLEWFDRLPELLGLPVPDRA
ncbi:PadR family transcriptional regulator [Nocardia sp. BMG51109]|uniref:PadR family transcriptional regulator n=1 Tax=Nocardia sp. BMG51109 TaxID=1056816 RepID=UPI000462EF46|nr:PadR family transcriptional regulator [Nocardia sp. BMG51109]